MSRRPTYRRTDKKRKSHLTKRKQLQYRSLPAWFKGATKNSNDGFDGATEENFFTAETTTEPTQLQVPKPLEYVHCKDIIRNTYEDVHYHGNHQLRYCHHLDIHGGR